MKQNTQEAIKLIEQVTAARHYTERGRNALTETIAAALFLSTEDKQALQAAGQLPYAKLQEVRNALLLLVDADVNEFKAAVLRAREEALSQTGNLPYKDKRDWLVYVHTALDSRSDVDQFEAACFLTAIGKRHEAYAKFVTLAARGDLTALWMAFGLARVEEDQANELGLIAELTELYDQGVIDYLPDELFARQEELEASGLKAGSGFDMAGNKIGF